MNEPATTSRIRWAARLDDVCEVSLWGTADLGYWQSRLAAESLTPRASNGRAQFLLVAAASKFLGVPFRE